METITKNGKRFVLLPESEYRRLTANSAFPTLPAPDKNGTRPALPSVRALLAQSIIRDRNTLGWSQAELARQARINVETLNRIEKARVTADQRTIERIDKALKRGISRTK